MLIYTTIKDALIELGVIDATEEPQPSDTDYALRTLNRILDGYNTQNLTIPYLHQIEYDKTEWNSETIEISNATGDEISPFLPGDNAVAHDKIVASPPQDIQQLYFRDNTIQPVDYQCTPMTQREYAQKAYKGIVRIPTKYYVVRNTPTSTVISFDAVPMFGLRLMILGKLPYRTDFVTTDDVQWGAGIEKMIMSRLAVEVGGSYHLEPPAATIGKAMEMESAVKAFNYSPRTIRGDIGLRKGRGRGRYNPARI